MNGLSSEEIALLLGQATSEIRSLCEAAVAHHINVLENALNQTIKSPTIRYDLKGTTAGQANSRNEIRLNLAALNNPEFRDYIVNQTIPHELAHIAEFQLYQQAGHGFRWKHLCYLLGIQPNRTHDLPLPKSRKTQKFKYRCNCGTHYLGKNRHNKTQTGFQRYYCRICGGLLERVAENEL